MITPITKALVVTTSTPFFFAFLGFFGLGPGDLPSLLGWQLCCAGGCFVGLYARKRKLLSKSIWLAFIVSQIISFSMFSIDFSGIELFGINMTRPFTGLIIGVLTTFTDKIQSVIVSYFERKYGVKK